MIRYHSILRFSLGLFLVILSVAMVPSTAFLSRNAPLSRYPRGDAIVGHCPPLHSAQQSVTYIPIFDFANETTVTKFERIDDAIMGGISLSSLRQSSNESFARWSGVCRLDGGGFCGTRTLPFEKPIEVGKDTQGIYLECRFTSDDEPERRVWKVTTRSEQSRGEQLYQAMFQLNNSHDKNVWTRVEIPLSTFRQVRGPRLVEGAPALDVSSGLYQIGLSLSKFMISSNVTEIPHFRPGFFELQIKEIGVYTRQKEDVNIAMPATLSKHEIAKKRPLLLKILLPITKLFFNEKMRRRDSAMRLLRQRGLTGSQAILFAFKLRARQSGFLPAMARSSLLILQDLCRTCSYWILRFALVVPIQFVLRLVSFIAGKIRSERLKSE